METIPTLTVLLISLTSTLVAVSLVISYLLVRKMQSVQQRRKFLVNGQGQGSHKDSSQFESLVDVKSGEASVISVLGSGGHTAEMITLMSELFELVNGDQVKLKVTYISAQTDHHSISKLKDLHISLGNIGEVTFRVLPRAREVGQSWMSSILTSIYTSIWGFFMVFKLKPDLVIVNGPGTSAIVAGIAFIQRTLFGSWLPGRCRIIYVESFARVESLSLSGKLAYRFADRFLVQWEELARCWPLSEYHGRLC